MIKCMGFLAALLVLACGAQASDDLVSNAVTDCFGKFVQDIKDRDAAVCVAVAPIYPHRAYNDSIEGECVVKFDLDAEGNILNETVSCQPEGIFEESTLKAFAKFEYIPRIENGLRVEDTNLERNFSYEQCGWDCGL